jgi:hypothetical protein
LFLPPTIAPAGGTLAARFIREKFDEVSGNIHHAGVLIHDDHAAGTHHGACLGEFIKAHFQVQQFLRDAASGRPSGGMPGTSETLSISFSLKTIYIYLTIKKSAAMHPGKPACFPSYFFLTNPRKLSIAML